MMTPIGASCAIRYHDSKDYFTAYISFGTWEDDAERDSFNVLDTDIFFYCQDLQELEALTAVDNGGDFIVKAYALEYQS